VSFIKRFTIYAKSLEFQFGISAIYIKFTQKNTKKEVPTRPKIKKERRALPTTHKKGNIKKGNIRRLKIINSKNIKTLHL